MNRYEQQDIEQNFYLGSAQWYEDFTELVSDRAYRTGFITSNKGLELIRKLEREMPEVASKKFNRVFNIFYDGTKTTK